MTYKWDSTVRAPTYLWFVQVDEYPWMTQWTTTSITRYDAFLSPSYWLFMNKFDSGLWSWLDQTNSSAMTEGNLLTTQFIFKDYYNAKE